MKNKMKPPQNQNRNKQVNYKKKKRKERNLRKRKQEWNGLSKLITKSTLTDPKLSLLTVLLQVNLDAGLKEIQLGLELLRHGSHGILHLGEAAVIPEEVHPAGTTRNRALGHLWDPNTISCTITKPPQMPRQVPAIIIIGAATYNHKDNFQALSNVWCSVPNLELDRVLHKGPITQTGHTMGKESASPWHDNQGNVADPNCSEHLHVPNSASSSASQTLHLYSCSMCWPYIHCQV